MNIHPIIVHFPIALLSLYSLIILFLLKKWFKEKSWKNTEKLLLITGILGVFLAKSTGEIAQSITKPNQTIG